MNEINLTLCIPTLTRYDTLAQCIHSALHGTCTPHTILVIDNGGNLPVDTYRDTPEVCIIQPPHNLGVAASWNTFLRSATTANVIICNDDVSFHSTTIQRLWEASCAYQHEGFFCPAGQAANSFSCFLLQQWLYVRIGPFDETFFPAYFEDNDFAYRMRLAGYSIVTVPECSYDHVGSATLKSYTPSRLEQHHLEFRKNQAYYIQKWGGLPHEERYTVPFQNGV